MRAFTMSYTFAFAVLGACGAPGEGGGDGGTLFGPDAGPGTGCDGDCEVDAGAPPPPPTWSCGEFACEQVEDTASEGSMVPLDGCHFEVALEEPMGEGEALADALLDRLESSGAGTRKTLAEVLNHMNRTGQAGLSSETESQLSGLDPTGFRWNSGDNAVEYWYPQGTTGSSDAADDGRVEGRRLLVTSWYHKTEERPTKGARISIADVSGIGVSYRHVLLVDPYEGDDGPNFGPAEYDGGNSLHVGGIAWWGDYLYVADTAKGLRIYDMSRMFRPSHFDDSDRIGLGSGRSDAHGYGYAAPRIARYRLTDASCPVRFSFVGLDRDADPPALVTGEYKSDELTGRISVWPIDRATGLLETREGTTRATQAALVGQTRAQGGIRVGGDFYISSSSQNDTRFGRLYRNRPGEQSSSVAWPYGCEDLYYERAEGLMWTSTEHPDSREVVGIPRPVD